jgi:hypothetical protein
VDLPGCKVLLSRTKPNTCKLEGADGMFFDLAFASPEERDIVALAIRELAGDSIEAQNDPQYHPVPPSTLDEDEDFDDDD